MKRLLGLLLLFLSLSVQSEEVFRSNLSVRALGMGNAYTSVVSDAYTLFYNPARLAYVDGLNFRLLSPYITVSDPLKLQEVVADSSSSNLSDTVAGLFDANVSGGLGTQLAFTMPRFGVAAFGDAQFSTDVNNPVLPETQIRAVADWGGIIGGSFPVLPGFLDVGVAVKRVLRQGGVVDVSAATLAELDLDLITDQIDRRGGAFGLDLGATLSIPGPIDASASLMWRNVGGLSFTRTGGSGAPPSEKDEMILGFAAGFDLPLFGMTAAMDFTNLKDSDVQLGKKINFGLEINLLNIDIRGGFHQGYYTAGAGIGLGLLDIDVATYGVELGEFAGQRIDRRYAIQLTLELGVDPFFDLSGSGSSGSRKTKRKGRRPGIKQRR